MSATAAMCLDRAVELQLRAMEGNQVWIHAAFRPLLALYYFFSHLWRQICCDCSGKNPQVVTFLTPITHYLLSGLVCHLESLYA
jgi:hypothetical protein